MPTLLPFPCGNNAMCLFTSCLMILSCLPHTIADVSAATGIHKVADPQQQQPGSVALELKNRDMDIKADDTYTYASIDVPPGKHHVRAFEPRADMGTVHHMLLYGCTVPTGGLPPKKHCTGKSLMFGWGKNAPAIELPEGVGFRTGDDDDSFSSLLLEIHYLIAPQTTNPDETSGMIVHLSPGIPKFTAGIMFFGASFDLRPGLREQLVVDKCCYTGPRPLTAMGVRVHAHDHARSIWLDRFAGGDTHNKVRLHTGDPQLPQTFVPVAEPFVIQPGDSLRATCKYDTSNEKRHIYSGSTHNDEMCNLYLMLYADAPQEFVCNDRGSRASAKIRDVASQMGPLRLVDPPGSDRTWPISIGQISGMQVTPDGTKVWISHGGNRRLIGNDTHDEPITVNRIACLNLLTGQIDRAFGDGDHGILQGLTLGPDGAVWVVDAGLRRVLRYSTEEELQREFGPKFESGEGTGSAELCRPTDIAVMEDGSFYVSDGHCNRVTQFNAEGKQVGDLTITEGNAAFDPHDLAVYSCRGEVAVADRKNKRVIIFAISSGRHSRTVDLSKYGEVYGLTVLRSTDIGMAGYYALCWDDDAATSTIVAIRPGYRGRDIVLAWDIDSDEMDISAPQRINVLAGKVGGSSSWGMGVNIFVAGTSTRGGGEDFKRLWLGRDSSVALVIDNVQEEEHVAKEEWANEDNGKEDDESDDKEHKATISQESGTNGKDQEGELIDPHEVSQKHTIGSDEFINSEISKIQGQEGNSDKEDVKVLMRDVVNVTLSADHLDYRLTQQGYMQYGRFMMTVVTVATLLFGGLCCLCTAKNGFRYQRVQVESSDEANEGVTYRDNSTEGTGNLGREHFSIVSSKDDPEAK